MQKRPVNIAAGIITTALLAVIFLISSTPFLPGLLLISLLCTWLYFRFRGIKRREIWINLAVIFALISLFEGLLLYIEYKDQSFKASEILDRVYESEPDSLLGWRLQANCSRTASKTVNGELIYQVQITTDRFSHRITPDCVSDTCPAVLFFGDSFTFGEGVHDTLTLPWLVSDYANNRINAINYGVYGYGPHQMLSAIERGDASLQRAGKVTDVVYQLLYPEHLYRMTGTRAWDTSGPRYILNAQGEAEFSGDFFTCNRWKNRLFNGVLSRSAIFRKLFSHTPPLNNQDKELFLAILSKSKQLLQKEHPDARFHVLIWDWTHGEEKELFPLIQKAGFNLHFISDWLPNGISSLDYKLHPLDRHPNSSAYHLIARNLIPYLNIHSANISEKSFTQ